MRRAAIFLTISALLFCNSAFPQLTSTAKPTILSTNSVEKKPKKPRTGTKWDAMDLGPFFSSGVAGPFPTLKGLSIKLGTNAAMCFDTELLRMSCGWTGGFLRLPTGRDGLEGIPEPAGAVQFHTPRGPGWAKDGSFADPRPAFTEDPKGKPCGPMPRDWVHWRGLYLNGANVVLSYSVGAASVLELPGVIETNDMTVFTRTFQTEGATSPLELMVAEEAGAIGETRGRVAFLKKSITPADDGTANCTMAMLIGSEGGTWQTTKDGRLQLKVAPSAKPGTFQVAIWNGPESGLSKFEQVVKAVTALPAVSSLTRGGAPLWPETLVTKGTLGKDDSAYTVDTMPLPDDNPWKSWIRCGGFDFFPGGTRAAICSVSGDVWIVDGIDDKLEKLTWKRFATGLFQPLGLKIVDDKVYVTGRDQITRLHDVNGDGEADFYENFNNDVSITSFYHEFCLNLETDSQGNFYFNKGGNLGEPKIPHQGTLLCVSKDGGKLDIVCTGLRAPNGLGLGPNDEITTADNEGEWVPSSRIDLCRPGRFNGHVFTAHMTPKPTAFEPPLLWLPHTYELDNSSGSQVWVTSDRWGPLKDNMLHTSYGACALFEVMQETVDGVPQAGAAKFPLKFDTGIMRGRFNPRDGQLYLAGLVVWQSKGPRQGAFHRVRYTGKPVHMPVAMHVKKNGIEVTFATPLDETTATDAANYAIEQWNYKWTSNYGSPDFSVVNPDKKGRDKVELSAVKLSPDKKTVFLEIPDLKPVMQMRIKYNLKAATGTPVASEIHNTINRVPQS